jgi:hypothetical protein
MNRASFPHRQRSALKVVLETSRRQHFPILQSIPFTPTCPVVSRTSSYKTVAKHEVSSFLCWAHLGRQVSLRILKKITHTNSDVLSRAIHTKNKQKEMNG